MNAYRKMNIIECDKYSPMLIDWLCDKFQFKGFNHHFSDKFIRWNIWDGELSIILDFRQEGQVTLFDHIPSQYKGVPQQGTGVMVNLKTLYFDFATEFNYVPLPPVSSKQVGKYLCKDHESPSDSFWIYTYHVTIEDGSIVEYSCQTERLDLKDYNKYTLPATLMERHLVNSLTAPVTL